MQKAMTQKNLPLNCIDHLHHVHRKHSHYNHQQSEARKG